MESGEWGEGVLDEDFDDEGDELEDVLDEFFGVDEEQEGFDGESSTSAVEFEYIDDLKMRSELSGQKRKELYDEQTEEGLSELGMHYCDDEE